MMKTALGSLMLLLCNTFGNYGWAILIVGLIVKLIMLPFQIKTKQSTLRTAMLTPRLKELEKKYRGEKQRYNEEVARLYKEAHVNPMSGCLWSLIPLPIMIMIFSAVREPLSSMLKLTAEEVTTLTQVVTDLGYYVAPTGRNIYGQLGVANVLHEHFAELITNGSLAAFADKLKDFSFEFLGLNLTATPKFNFLSGGYSTAAFVMFCLPFLSGFLTYAQSALTQELQPAQDPQTAQSTKTMKYTMPLFSIYICFIMPVVMVIYWLEQSILGIIQELILNKIYRQKINDEMSGFLEAQKKKEEEIERKRAETERLKAEGKTQQNASTSKKRLAAAERNAEEQRQAARRAAERAARGIEEEIPPSQVGNRRYARGRAYDPDRYLYETTSSNVSPDIEEE